MWSHRTLAAPESGLASRLMVRNFIITLENFAFVFFKKLSRGIVTRVASFWKRGTFKPLYVASPVLM